MREHDFADGQADRHRGLRSGVGAALRARADGDPARVRSGAFVRIEHMGSTAVPGLAAKPIIDMMPGVRSLDDAPPLIAQLESIGYEYVPEYEQPSEFDEGMPFRRYFRKDVNGERAFHMHMVEADSDFWRTQLLFRDFLRISPEDAAEYERVKRRVAAEYNAALTPTSNANVGYTDKKSECVNAIMAKARAHFG